ncbi:MAG: hypothetical protein QOK10_1319 [Pseudonocardiales bacterium]|jgi:uncharacterized protein YbjQ (UPF0145 family)|nr:hypothetical protein [Pseudonocardiales bacterium]
MLCVTSNDIPGWEIQRVCGEVFGVTVRSRNAFSQMGAGFKSLVGGELQGMTKQVIQSRNEAMGRLFAEAQARGGNALIAMRFDTTELGGNWSEICAYATAVVAVPVTDEAKQTAIQLGYSRPGTAGGAPQSPASQQPPIGGAPGMPAGLPSGAPAGVPGYYAGPPSQPSQHGQYSGPPVHGQPGQGQPWGNTQYSQPQPPLGGDAERREPGP